MTLAGCVAALVFTSPARAEVLRPVAGSETLGMTVARARPGDVVEVPPGTWTGNVVIGEGVTLRGAGGVVDGGGEGTAVRLDGPRAVVEGVTIRNSGRDVGKATNACVYVAKTATGAVVRRTHLADCGFGIWLNETTGATVTENRIVGSTQGDRVNRGNGIQLYAVSEIVVSRNVITDGSDGIYVAATSRALFDGNILLGTRIGLHYMWSHGNVVYRNVVSGSTTAFALMQSKRLTVMNNVAQDNVEKGILFRDALSCNIISNVLERNAEGMFFYSSVDNVIADNILRDNGVGMKVWAGSWRNSVTGNQFIGNRTPVMFADSKDLVWAAEGPGNYWSDYVGWDQDADGLGDRPYRVDSFTNHLIFQYPSAVLLLRSPALELLSHVEQAMPVLRTPTIVDKHPLVAPGGP